MNSLLQDLRFALRQLRHSPGFALTIVLTLALGIGAATAVFSVIDAVLLRPLPFAHQDRLVFPNTIAREGYTQPWSYLSYLDARAQLKTFAAFAGCNPFSKINLQAPAGPVSLQSVRGTDNFLDVFGVKPLLGRTFLPGEDQPGRDDIAVLSYEVWKKDFAGQSNVLGKTVRLDGVPYTVIGVMPAGFRFPLSARNAIYMPLHPEDADPQWKQHRGSHWLMTVGLLQPGVSHAAAQADMRHVFDNLGRAYPTTDFGRTVSLIPLRDEVAGNTRAPLKTLLWAVLALLAIACVNVAGLLLARGVKREREFALRTAVGAARRRLVRQMVTESVTLALAGLAAGIVLCYVLLSAMRTFLISAFDRGAEVHLNVEVLLMALAASALTGLMASLFPALRLSGLSPNSILRTGGSAGTARGQHRLRSAFVVTQVALSLVLLVTAGLLLKNLESLLHANLGFNPDKILTLPIDLSRGSYAGRDPLPVFYRPLLDRVTHLPSVEAAGLINIVPIQNYGSNSDVHIAGQPPYPPQQEMLAEQRFVSAGYFDAMGIKLVRGRMLSPALDTPDKPAGSIVVNQAFQRKFFSSGGNPVGAHIDDNDKAELKTGIVGITTNVRQNIVEPPLAEMDWLVDQIDAKSRLDYLASMSLVVRSSGDPRLLVPALRDIMHRIDPTVPFQTPETMKEIVSDSLVFQRMENWLFGTFAALALLLAVVGLYGLISHEVGLRTRDIGVRMALGATRMQILLDVMARVALLTSVGIALGWILTMAFRKVLASVVELHASHDIALLAALTLALGLIGVAASLLPARRAASIDPMDALRSE